jgi:hypothetical protein
MDVSKKFEGAKVRNNNNEWRINNKVIGKGIQKK